MQAFVTIMCQFETAGTGKLDVPPIPAVPEYALSHRRETQAYFILLIISPA